MLDVVGVGSLDGLYADVPESVKLKADYELPEEMSEMEVRDLFAAIADFSEPLVLKVRKPRLRSAVKTPNSFGTMTSTWPTLARATPV